MKTAPKLLKEAEQYAALCIEDGVEPIPAFIAKQPDDTVLVMHVPFDGERAKATMLKSLQIFFALKDITEYATIMPSWYVKQDHLSDKYPTPGSHPDRQSALILTFVDRSEKLGAMFAIDHNTKPCSLRPIMVDPKVGQYFEISGTFSDLLWNGPPLSKRQRELGELTLKAIGFNAEVIS